MSRPHGYQRYVHDACRCDVCKDANRLHSEARREITPLRTLLRERAREELAAGRNAEQAASRIVNALDESDLRAFLRVIVYQEANLLVLAQVGSDLPRGASPPSGRWELVKSLAADPRAWPITTPRGRSIVLGDCKAEDLEAIAEQYQGDADEAERWAKKVAHLMDELDAARVDRVADLEREVVAKVMQ